MAPTMRATKAKKASRGCFTTVTACVLAGYMLADLQASDLLDADSILAFTAPSYATSLARSQSSFSSTDAAHRENKAGWGLKPRSASSEGTSTLRKAVPAISAADITARCINAMGAGAVAAVIQAALSAVLEPIVNRVLVNRMKVMDAVRDVSPAQMLKFFKTTLFTNFLKFPLFELLTTFLLCLNLPPAIRGMTTGFVLTSLTLPVTNYRYRKSMDLPVDFSKLYQAYFPTVIRDMAYGVSRNYLTAIYIACNPGATAGSPSLLFPVVIGACVLSAPFNEWRGYLLQSKGKELTFDEFFKPVNFMRSTSLGAVKQGAALAIGYWAAPPVKAFVTGLIASFK